MVATYWPETNQSINQSIINQSINQSMNQSIIVCLECRRRRQDSSEKGGNDYGDNILVVAIHLPENRFEQLLDLLPFQDYFLHETGQTFDQEKIGRTLRKKTHTQKKKHLACITSALCWI